ncbi:MAG: hypothetical protein ABJN40_06610 [Sneathiella sp.]
MNDQQNDFSSMKFKRVDWRHYVSTNDPSIHIRFKGPGYEGDYYGVLIWGDLKIGFSNWGQHSTMASEKVDGVSCFQLGELGCRVEERRHGHDVRAGSYRFSNWKQVEDAIDLIRSYFRSVGEDESERLDRPCPQGLTISQHLKVHVKSVWNNNEYVAND